MCIRDRVDDASQINFEHAVNVSAGAARFDHPLRNDLAHVGHGHELAWSDGRRRNYGLTRRGGRNWSSRAALNEIENVLFGDAPTGAGSTYFCEIHIAVSYTHLDVYKRQNPRSRAEADGR